MGLTFRYTLPTGLSIALEFGEQDIADEFRAKALRNC